MRSVVAFAVAGVLALAAAPARADEPWTAGVTAAQKAEAQHLLEAGNALFLERKYADALARYQQAVAAWDHPAIRFNIVRCLIQLDRPVEAADNLKRALAYGAAPLEDSVYAEALAYEKLLAAQVGELVVACTQPDVALTLDGAPLGTCPTTVTRRASPGVHQLVGTRAGFVPHTETIGVTGGRQVSARVELAPIATRVAIVHRWPSWMPWLVFGGGFALAGVGGLVELKAAGDFTNYDRLVEHDCAAGCAPGDPNLARDRGVRSTAVLENRIAVGVIGVGVAAIAAGGALIYLNRARTVELAPMPVAGGAGLALSFATP